MTDQDRLVFIFEEDIARRRELVRISQVAIGLHKDRIAGHRAIVAAEQAEIDRLERCRRLNEAFRQSRQSGPADHRFFDNLAALAARPLMTAE